VRGLVCSLSAGARVCSMQRARLVSHVRLDRARIESITDVLVELPNMCNLYLQVWLWVWLAPSASQTLQPSSVRVGSCVVHLSLTCPVGRWLQQHNRLQDVAALGRCESLRFLTLAHNFLSDVSALATLPNLMFLDVSYNTLPSVEDLVGRSLRRARPTSRCRWGGCGRGWGSGWGVQRGCSDCCGLPQALSSPTATARQGPQRWRESELRSDGAR
jgi:hypothetical protein